MLVVEVFFDVVLFADCFERLGDLDCLSVGTDDTVGPWSGCHYDELEVSCVVRFSFEFDVNLVGVRVTTASVGASTPWSAGGLAFRWSLRRRHDNLPVPLCPLEKPVDVDAPAAMTTVFPGVCSDASAAVGSNPFGTPNKQRCRLLAKTSLSRRSSCAESIEWKSRSRDSGEGAGTKLVLRSDSVGRRA